MTHSSGILPNESFREKAESVCVLLCSEVEESSRLHSPLPTDPYQPKSRLARSSSASAAITFSLETPGETESIGSFSVGVGVCACMCVWGLCSVWERCMCMLTVCYSMHLCVRVCLCAYRMLSRNL